MSECENTPPTDRTRPYATLHRRGPDDSKHELRVGTDRYNGKEFAAIRLWCEDEHGGMWPSPRTGCTIRRHELIETIEALTRIARDLGELPAEDPPATVWRSFGGDGGPTRPSPAAVNHTQLYAGGGIRRVNLSEATRSAAFKALVEPRED